VLACDWVCLRVFLCFCVFLRVFVWLCLRKFVRNCVCFVSVRVISCVCMFCVCVCLRVFACLHVFA